MSRTSLRVKTHTTVWLNVKELLTRSKCNIWSLSDRKKVRIENHLVRKGTLNDLKKVAKWLSSAVEYLPLRCIWLYVIVMSRTSFRVNPCTTFWLNVMELLARSRHHIWSLNVSNKIRTLNRLVRKRTLNHLAKQGKSLSCVARTYLDRAFYSMSLSYQLRVSESVETLLFIWIWRNSLLESATLFEV